MGTTTTTTTTITTTVTTATTTTTTITATSTTTTTTITMTTVTTATTVTTTTTKTTITATTVTTTTTTTTTTTRDYFDFTSHFQSIGQKKGRVAKFPDGNEYLCCCQPDEFNKSVQCKLVDESLAWHDIRRRFSNTCGTVLKGDYHSWHHVYYSKAGIKRKEFEGLENLGRCIVKTQHLPKMFSKWPDHKIQQRLDDVARLVKG